jgi:anti-anti-sigma regulatory factor
MLVRLDLVAGRVALVGRLNRQTAHLLDDAISALLLTDCPLWTVDVSGLTVADRPGLRAVETAYRRALQHGRGMAMVGTPPGLHRALTRLALEEQALVDTDCP